LDIVIAIDDWTDYGWDNAFNEKGIWTNGPLHGTVYLIEQTKPGVFETPKQIIAGGKPIDNLAFRVRFSKILMEMATLILFWVNSSTD
jgi:hypothetical protein